jgi:hypothetical protein
VSSPPADRVNAVPLVPLSGGPFSVQLVLAASGAASAEAPDDPFYALSDEDEHTRVFLGAIKGDADSVVDFCAVKLVKNSFPPAGILEAAPQTNLSVEGRLREEAERIRALAPAARFAPRLWKPGAAEGEAPDLLPPLFFCRSGRRLFTPPCPRCGGPLAACRDDAVLVRAKLPLWSSSLERFLFCARCVEEDAESPFYSFEAGEAGGKANVLSAEDLAQQLGEALAGGAEGEQVLAAFPCADCVEEGTRFAHAIGSGARPAPFWEGRWWPLAFYGSPCVITGFGDVGLDEFADLLGGRPLAPVAGEKPLPFGFALLARARYPLAFQEAPPMQRLFFAGSSAGLDAVEIFLLKLAAFRQVVEAVLSYYRVLRRPHLDLHPRHLLFDLARPGDGLPLFWSFQARLHGLSSAARVEALPGAGDVVVPPRNPAVPYAPPEVLEFHLTPPRPAQVVLSDLEEVGGRGGEKTWRFHGRLTDPYGIYPSPRDHDWVFVSLDNDALALGVSSLPCRRDPRAKPDVQELAFISEPVALDPAGAARLKKTIGARIPGMRYKVYTDYSAPSDLYSLGMILLRLLIGNDGQDARAIASAVDRVVKKLSAAGQTTLAGYRGGGPGVATLLEKDPEIFQSFKKSNVFYQDIDRRNDRPNAIPDTLWKRAILLALRLATRVGDFSLCEHPADYDEAHPTAKLEQVVTDVALLQGELRALLFDRQASNVEVQQVLAELAVEKAVSERS